MQRQAVVGRAALLLRPRAAEGVAGATGSLAGTSRPIKAILDPYNPTGSTRYVNFTTSKTLRWKTAPDKCHVNWVICDSEWEADFCRLVEAHPRILGYVKNHSLGLEVPYPVFRSSGARSGVLKVGRRCKSSMGGAGRGGFRVGLL